MKIAIITITNGANYGNRLQNYALQNTLVELGHEVQTIQMKTSKEFFCKNAVIFHLKRFVKRIVRGESNKNYHFRKIKFDAFNERYVCLSRYALKCSKAPTKIESDYDLFVFGSDQIWNPRIPLIKESIEGYLGEFVTSKKKVAYAASIATDDIPETYIPLFAKALPKFEQITVREESGYTIMSNMFGIDAPVVLDPTMLLDADVWRRIENKPSYMGKERFIVTYFLSGRNETISDYIQRVASLYGVDRVINLDFEFLNDKQIENSDYFATDPCEFLWLIDNAECVLTDSYHGSVFSVLFHKPFTVFERHAVDKDNNMVSRLYTLLNRFELEEQIDSVGSPSKRPYFPEGEAVDKIIATERNASIEILKKMCSV